MGQGPPLTNERRPPSRPPPFPQRPAAHPAGSAAPLLWNPQPNHTTQTEQRRLAEVLREKQERGRKAGFKRAAGVFWIFRLYDALMILSLLAMHPSLEASSFPSMHPTLDANSLACALWASLTAFFCLDLCFAGKILRRLNAGSNGSDAVGSARTDAELMQLAYYNFVSNTVTLSLWMLYHSFCLNNSWSIGVLATSAIRLVKLRPVCQFYDALHAEDVDLALGKFAEASIWASAEVPSSIEQDNESHLPHRQQSASPQWNFTHSVLAILLLLSFAFSLGHSESLKALTTSGHSIFLPTENRVFLHTENTSAVMLVGDEQCQDQWGRCPSGSCWMFGVVMGCFGAVGTIWCLQQFNQWRTKREKCPIPEPAIYLLGAASFVLATVGGAREQCVSPGLLHSVGGAVFLPFFIVKAVAFFEAL